MTTKHDAKELIIVTGSSGFIGKRVIDALRHDYQVIGFDRDGNPQPPKDVECVCVDLTSDDSVKRGLARVRFRYDERIASVIHLAAYYNFSGEPSDLYEEVTVKGTQRLIDALQDFDVQQFLFTSTMLVHKPTEPGRPINEDAPLEGRWDYPKSKIKTETLLRARHGDIPIVLLRVAGAYSDDCDSIPLAHQIDRIYKSTLTSHVYPGDTSRGQAFVHIDDIISAITSAVSKRKSLGGEEAFLIGEPETLSYDELQHEFARLIHSEDEWTTQTIPKAVARSGAWVQNQIPGVEEPFIKPWMVDLADDHYELDITRAREKLGWEPAHSLRETLPTMIERLRRDPDAWFRKHDLEPPSESEKEEVASTGRKAATHRV